MIQYQVTKKLFRGIYQYKIVLVCSGASLFRSGDMEATLKELNNIVLAKGNSFTQRYGVRIKTADELDYAKKLQSKISKMSNFEIRVESPWITIYTNSRQDIDALAKIDNSKVKYICKPPTNASLEEGTIIMPKMPYDYRVTLGKTTNNYLTFIEWASTTSKVKLTKSCIKDLSKDRSWGGTHLYVSGDKVLLVTKMHLGGAINKIERIIKA
jgi:hypothetical protein